MEMVCVTKHGATFSSLNISRRYDEHARDTNMLAIRYYYYMLETEELISKIGSLHILW